MNWYSLLLVLYVFLTGFYWWSAGREDPIPGPLWNRLVAAPTTTPVRDDCHDDSDCPSDHLCMRGECIPKALRGGSCNPATGDWVVEMDRKGRRTVTCVCRQPHLVTQKLKGGNCNVDVACAPHGRIADWATMDSCDCEEGYESVPGKLECRRLTAVEQESRRFPCESDEDELRNAVHYDYDKYLLHHRDKRCLKRPCGFDVLTGRSFPDGAAYHEGGCRCDPTLGRFGVVLDSDFSTLKHYNGCASILAREPERPLDVEIHAYFYLQDDEKPVVSFLVFKNLDPDLVNPVFREAVEEGTLVLEQDWPHDTMQYVLETQPFVVHSRRCESSLFSLTCDEWLMKENAMRQCERISWSLTPAATERANAYVLLYEYPVCRMGGGGGTAYRGRFVVNPFHALYTDYPELLRSDGLVMKMEMGKWLIDFAPARDIEYLMKNSTRVPQVWDERSRAFAQGMAPFAYDTHFTMF